MSVDLTERLRQTARPAGGITMAVRELPDGYELVFFRDGEHLRTFYVSERVAERAERHSFDAEDMLEELPGAIDWLTPSSAAP